MPALLPDRVGNGMAERSESHRGTMSHNNSICKFRNYSRDSRGRAADFFRKTRPKCAVRSGAGSAAGRQSHGAGRLGRPQHRNRLMQKPLRSAAASCNTGTRRGRSTAFRVGDHRGCFRHDGWILQMICLGTMDCAQNKLQRHCSSIHQS